MRYTRLLAACSLVLGLSTSALAGDTPPKNIDLKAPDSTNLKAIYYDAGKPGPAIVMLHACNKDRWSWVSLATAAAARGFHLIALDYRGFGESGGEGGRRLDPEQQAIVDGQVAGRRRRGVHGVAASQQRVDKTAESRGHRCKLRRSISRCSSPSGIRRSGRSSC